MGITLGSNFDVETGLPLDSRLVVSGLIQRDGINSLKRYEGMIVYVESEATNYQLVGGISNTDWAELSGGGIGGSGVKNFITAENSSLEDAINDWTTYNDSGSFVDGTGGVSGLTISITDDTSEVLDGVGSLQIFKPSLDCEGHGAAIEFDIPRGYRGKLSQISFLVDGTAQTGNDFEVRAYDVTNSKPIDCGTDDEIEIPKQVGEIKLPFKALASCETARLCFNCKDSNTDSYSIFIDEVKVSPTSTVNVESTTDWLPMTVTNGWAGTHTGLYKRSGDTMHVKMLHVLSGTPSGTYSLYLSDFLTPLGLTVDSSKILDSGDTVESVGTAQMLDAANQIYTGNIRYRTGGDFVITGGVSSSGLAGDVNSTQPFAFGSGDKIGLEFSIPITEWANSRQVLNEYQLSQQTVKFRARMASNQNVTSSIATTVNFTASSFDTHNGHDAANKAFVVPRSGFYNVSTRVYYAGIDSPTTTTVQLNVRKNDTTDILQNFHSDARSDGSNLQINDIVYLEKRDFLQVTVNSPDANYTISASTATTYFSVWSVPDFTQYGAIKDAKKIQTKTLTGNKTSDGTMSDLTFSNLTVGRWYQVEGQFLLTVNDTADNAEIYVNHVHNTATLARSRIVLNQDGSSSADRATIPFSYKFQAKVTSIAFVAQNAAAQSLVLGDGTRETSWVQLSECDQMQETSEW